MRDDDEENQADDYRNDKMSDLAYENERLRESLAEIRDVWAGLEGLSSDLSNEIYLFSRLRETFQLACEAIERSK